MQHATQDAIARLIQAMDDRSPKGRIDRCDGTADTQTVEQNREVTSSSSWAECLNDAVEAILVEEPDSEQLRIRVTQAAVVLIEWLTALELRGRETKQSAMEFPVGTAVRVTLPGRKLVYTATIVGPGKVSVAAVNQVFSLAEVKVHGIVQPKESVTPSSRPLLDLIRGRLDEIRSDND